MSLAGRQLGRSAFTLLLQLLVASQVMGQTLYPRGHATCNVSVTAADIVAEARAVGGASICGSDDCDRDGVLTPADVICAAGCLFNECPIPPNAPRVTAVRPITAPNIAPLSTVQMTVVNFDPSNRSKRVTIGGVEAQVVDQIAPDALEVIVPGEVSPGPANVVAYDGDLAGPPLGITIAAAVRLGPPDTFGGTLDLLDTITAKLLAENLEAAYGDGAPGIRETLQIFRDNLAANRAALDADPDFTPTVRAQLDAAFDNSGLPETIRQVIADIDAGTGAQRGEGGGAADTDVLRKAVTAAIVAASRSGATLRATIQLLRLTAGLVAGSLGVAILAGIAAGLAIVGAVSLIPNRPEAPVIDSITYMDPLGRTRAYPSPDTIGGGRSRIRIIGRHIDAHTRLRIQTSTGVREIFSPLESTADSATYEPFFFGEFECGKITFSLVSAGLVSNTVSSQMQPVLPDRTVMKRPGDDLCDVGRGFLACEHTLTLKGPTELTQVRSNCSVHLPTIAPGVYGARVTVEGVDSIGDLRLQIASLVTGLTVSCEPTELVSPPGSPADTHCTAKPLPDGVQVLPAGIVPVWSSSDASIVSAPGPGFDTTATAGRPGSAKLKAKLPFGAGIDVSSSDVSIDVVDKTPPELSLSSSPGAGKVGGGTAITVTANATDNGGVQKLSLAAGGEAVADGRAQTFDCSSQMTCSNTFTVTTKRNGFANGEVSIVVNVSDVAGNESHQDLAFDISPNPPLVLSVAPSPASPGQAVAITGAAFGENQDGGSVTIGGMVPPITGWSDTIIAVIVPDLPGGVVPVIVTVKGVGSNAGALTILGSGPPMITGITPAEVPPRGMVTVTGTSFGAMQAGTVDVAGGDATVTSWSDTAITFTVPEGTPLGPVAVAVVVHGVRSNEVGLTIKGPEITGVAPAMVNPGDTVTITGAGFGDMQGGSTVTIGGSAAAVTGWSATSITVTVPMLPPGPVKVVVTVNSISSAPAPLTIIGPYITSLAPAAVNPQERVTLNGGGFGDPQGDSVVTIGGTPTRVVSWSESVVVVEAPRLPSGPVPVIATVKSISSAPASLRILGTGDVQVTLEWEDTNDLDLHVTEPGGEETYYLHPSSKSGGVLDVDANAGCNAVTSQPRENIFWPMGKAPLGMYSVSVVYYEGCSNPKVASSFKVRIRVAGVEKYVIGDKTVGPGAGSSTSVISFPVPSPP